MGPRRAVNKKFKKTGTDAAWKIFWATDLIERAPGSGRPPTTSVDAVEEPGALTWDASFYSSNLFPENLKFLKCLKRRRVHELIAAKQAARVQRPGQLPQCFSDWCGLCLVHFTDEKNFTVVPPSDMQNDCLYVTRPSKTKNVSARRPLGTLMMSVEISRLGCIELIFVDPWAQINGQCYRDVVLQMGLLRVFG